MQINCALNGAFWPTHTNLTISGQPQMTFAPLVLEGSLTWVLTGNLAQLHSAAAGPATYSIKVGVYSLNGGTLSIKNWISGSIQDPDANNKWLSFTATSAAENLSPGSWWLGFWISHNAPGGTADQNLFCHLLNANNAFPGAFVGGKMTATTNALPNSVATSDLDVTFDTQEFVIPHLILTA